MTEKKSFRRSNHPDAPARRPTLKQSPAALAVASLLASGGVTALEFTPSNGANISLDISASYSAQTRVEDQNDDLLNSSTGLGFGTLGDTNFDRDHVTQNKLSLLADLDANFGDYGVFVRGRGWYDKAYDKDFDSNVDAIEDYHKQRLEFLDMYAYGYLSLGAVSDVSFKVGDHVVSWGESLFQFGGISSSQGPLDITKTRSPGTELKEVFLPVGGVSLDFGLPGNFSASTYYQYDWDASRIDAPGSYFSPLDVVGQGADTMTVLNLVAPTPITEDEPEVGQYGVALRYLAEQLNETEFGFYYINYNDTLPALQLQAGSLTTLRYFEDIDLIGASFSSVVGETNLSGEISYRDGHPVRLNAKHTPAANPLYFAPGQTTQAQVSAIHAFGARGLVDNLTWYGEVGGNYILGVDDIDGINVPSDVEQAAYGDRLAWGVTTRLKADFFNIAPALDMSVSTTLRKDVNGVSAVAFTYTEQVQDLSLGLDFIYLGKYGFGLNYTTYMADPDIEDVEFAHMTSDRDFVGLYAKTTF